MAAVSAPHVHSALTPSSSHGRQKSGNYSVQTLTANPLPSKTDDYSSRAPLSHTNGHALGHQTSRPDLSQKRTDTFGSGRSADSAYLAPSRVNALNRKDSSHSETGSAPDSLLDLYGNRSHLNSMDYGERKLSNGDVYNDDEDPGWIHRDKLARIESQELQAAGIILPMPRGTSKLSHRDNSREQQGNGLRSEQAGQNRQRMQSLPMEEEEIPENSNWDLRSPEEAAQDQEYLYQDVSSGAKGVSRIPVCKTSPIPIPVEHLERDTPMQRKKSGSWGEDEPSISNPKSRSRSGSIKLLQEAAGTPTPAKRVTSDNPSSPPKKTVKKTTPAGRNTSTPKTKIRSGTNSRDISGAQRPATRSGELNTTKRPEGDPPWLANSYKPDPRLPPDQQLLPTVAKRLQQEQWEKEGKFGNAYDKSFRPLNDDQFLPPEPGQRANEAEQEKGDDVEWPLRSPKSPVPSTGQPSTPGGYSTMPKIAHPGSPVGAALPSPQAQPPRTQESPKDAKERGCGCCVVM